LRLSKVWHWKKHPQQHWDITASINGGEGGEYDRGSTFPFVHKPSASYPGLGIRRYDMHTTTSREYWGKGKGWAKFDETATPFACQRTSANTVGHRPHPLPTSPLARAGGRPVPPASRPPPPSQICSSGMCRCTRPIIFFSNAPHSTGSRHKLASRVLNGRSRYGKFTMRSKNFTGAEERAIHGGDYTRSVIW